VHAELQALWYRQQPLALLLTVDGTQVQLRECNEGVSVTEPNYFVTTVGCSRCAHVSLAVMAPGIGRPAKESCT
jgi:hypothetical protein